ncbi:hypothetical protein [Lysinibacter cavernae]|uniref:Uncharacterized protein n=1 Tax=Lysinibacter cavernae TaxID=1640652 RepID=A0A7X5QZ02_9MICO|nr:hypothetical protein [Lysinibacter cavernae]NIH52576.1 hypothetical protein [Lysinibacter cavernae]
MAVGISGGEEELKEAHSRVIAERHNGEHDVEQEEKQAQSKERDRRLGGFGLVAIYEQGRQGSAFDCAED